MNKWVVVAALFSLDFYSKLIADQFGFVVFNPGFSFSIGAGAGLTWLHWPITAVIFYFWWRSQPSVILNLLIAASLGNGYDRFFYQGVRDFIHYPLIQLSGNVADIYLFVALLLVLTKYNTGYGTHRSTRTV